MLFFVLQDHAQVVLHRLADRGTASRLDHFGDVGGVDVNGLACGAILPILVTTGFSALEKDIL